MLLMPIAAVPSAIDERSEEEWEDATECRVR